MSLAPRSLSKASQLQAALRPLVTIPFRGFATGDPLKDPRTTSSQQRAHETDEATKDSIRDAAEGKPGEAAKDIGEMAKNAAKGAKESAKLMYDSVKGKVAGKTEEMKEQAPEKAQELKDRTSS